MALNSRGYTNFNSFKSDKPSSAEGTVINPPEDENI
jgi:hypothetical protein